MCKHRTRYTYTFDKVNNLNMLGRKKPYTELGISRVPCARCGAKSTQQWQVCSNDNRWMGVCKECDIALNALVIDFFGLPKDLLKKYIINFQA